MKFINRQTEIAFLSRYFANEPNSLLFVYGPKSSGKSTLLSKVVNELDTKKYAVNFLDLRGVLIYDFQSFLDVFFPKNIRERAKDIIEGISVNIGFFAIKASDEPILKKNAFKIMEDKLISAKKRGIQPIIILDEIQSLKNIYLNKERYLVDELLNLFVRLTKVMHTAHVILATSDSYFIEEIYMSVKLQQSSNLYLIDHLEKHPVEEWLQEEHFTKDEIQTIWYYIEGSPWEITEIIMQKRQGKPVEEACQYFINDKYAKIREFRNILKEEGLCDELDRITKEIVQHGCYVRNDQEDAKTVNRVIKKMVAHDFWFYKTGEQKIIANSQSIYWAFERMVKAK